MPEYDPDAHDAWLEADNPDDQQQSNEEAKQDHYNEW